jgi:two-component system sensor histidine kinase QseC
VKLYSLRRAMTAAIMIPLALAITAMAISAVAVTQRTVALLLDDQMQQEASFVLLLARHEATEGEAIGQTPTVRSPEFEQLFGVQNGFRIWSRDTVVTQSGALPATTKPPVLGFSDRHIAGAHWRSFAITYAGEPVIVEVSQSLRLRSTVVREIMLSLLLPVLSLILAIGAIIYIQVASALRPVQQISAQIDARAPSNLEPLHGHRVPVEIAPLFDAFNRLIARMRAAIAHEREFADNAAHELRTPIAAVKARAQVVERALDGDPNRQAIARGLVAATNRAAGVIDQLLDLSRLSGSEVVRQPVDMSKLTDTMARVMVSAAIAKGQNFEAEIAPDIIVEGQLEALMMVVRNLLDNAIRYTPAGGDVGVELKRLDDGQVVLRVFDTGPGVPPDRQSAMFDRFVRLSSNEPGSGLGLSIVDRIVTRHAGQITVANRDPHGLVVTVTLPTPREI